MSTLGEMRDNVLLRIAESSGGTFTDVEINRMIQKEYEHIQTQINMKNDEFLSKRVVTNTAESNVYAWPSDFLKLLMLELEDPQGRFWEIPKTSLHKVNDVSAQRWWIHSERPSRYYIIGSNYYLSPAQADGVDNLRMTYVYIPVALTDDEDVPIIPSLYHEILEVGAVNRLRKAVKEPPLDEQEYATQVLNLIETISPRVKHSPKQVRMVPGIY